MKDISELKEEIVALLLSKVKGVVDGYRERWDEDLTELFEVKGNLDDLEASKDELMAEYSKLRPIVNSEMEKRNLLDRKLPRLEKTLVATRKKVSSLTARLTFVESFDYPSPMLNFIPGDSPPSYVDMIKKKEELVAERKKLDKKRK